jgi:predicted site-specific integrase-resolvase
VTEGLVTLRRAAELLSVSPATTRRLAEAGKLELVRVSPRRVGISVRSIRELLGEPLKPAA